MTIITIGRVFLASLLFTEACFAADPLSRARQVLAQVNSTSVTPLASNSSDVDSTFQFKTNKTARFAVDGKGIPEVSFNVGESYAGLMPISASPNETRKLYFWFFPSTNPKASDEITVWLNGGPGCSSLGGFIQENGPFLWQDGTYKPVKNPYSWNKLTNMVWIEQPVGTGYSQGKPNITDEIGLAEEFKGFWKNFVDTFDLHKRKVYLTGESYAGFYVPYIANSFIKASDKNYFNLAGIAINDPVISTDRLQQDTVAVPFVDYWSKLFNFDNAMTKSIDSDDVNCGLKAYRDKYFRFPPPAEHFPDPPTSNSDECYTWSNILTQVLKQSPCFNIYHIQDGCPFLTPPLGAVNDGDYVPYGLTPYFNRADVKKAINAPVGATWRQCAPSGIDGTSVFASGYDASPGPALDGTLQNVIEKTTNVIIGSGGTDFILPTNGTLFALQNVTWNGGKGLSAYPSKTFSIPAHVESSQGAIGGAGYQGTWTEERGLTFYEVNLAGHELPGYALSAGYRVLQLLLGRIESLDDQNTPL